MCRRTKRKVTMVTFILFGMIFLLGMANLALAQEKSPIKIGLVTWTEGPALSAGRLHTRGFNAAIKYINDKGGILGGRKVVGVTAPQGETGETAKSSALKLCQKEKVKMLVGPHWAMAAPAGLSVAKRFNVPYTLFQGGTWLYEQNYPGTCVFSGPAYGRSMAQIKWAEKKGFKKVVLVFSDIPFNHDVEKAIKSKWGKADSPVQILGDTIWYTWGQTELKKETTMALGRKPDLVWGEPWSSNVTIAFMKELRELGYKGAHITDSDLLAEAVEKLPKEISEGHYVNKEWVCDATIPENKAFCDYMQKLYGEPPDHDEEVIWSEVVFMLLAMDKAGTEGDGTIEGLMKINKAMHSLNWIGPRGIPVRLDSYGLGRWENMGIAQIKGGRFVASEYIPMEEEDWLPKID